MRFLPYTYGRLLELLASYWPVLAVSFAATLLLTPICRRIAIKARWVDRPDDFLKPHKKPIPYLGGVAIFGGWAAGLASAVVLLDLPVPGNQTLGILLAGTGIVALGLFDDLRMMNPKAKLLGNIAVALWLIMGLGIGGDISGALTGVGLHFSEGETWLKIAYSWPVAILIIVGACNATNLIDGMDGLCSGVLGIISIGLLLLSVDVALLYPGEEGNGQRLILCLAMLGAAFGFLPFNRNPAKIFMGDAGSMLLGLNAGILLLLFFQFNKLRWVIGALIVFGLPIGDMMLALVRRWRNARPVMQGDRSHFYDQLTDRGFSVKKVVGISYGLTILFAIAGCCLVIFLRLRQAIPAYLGFLAFWVILVGRMGMLQLEADRRPSSADPPKGPAPPSD